VLPRAEGGFAGFGQHGLRHLAAIQPSTPTCMIVIRSKSKQRSIAGITALPASILLGPTDFAQDHAL
jgi:hypothetical protein